MTDIQRSSLFGKLNPIAYQAIESATVFAKLRGNPNVEFAHWLHQLLHLKDSDLHRIIRHFRLDAARISADVVVALERLPRGATTIANFASDVEETIVQAWLYATLRFGDQRVRTGYLLIGQLRTPRLRGVLASVSRELGRLDVDELGKRFDDIIQASPEQVLGAREGAGGRTRNPACPPTPGALPPAEMGRQEALRRFTSDLTERARSGEIDPIVGRDDEIRQCVDVLLRRRQNNPILTGEAGVGKTAIVEGFAQRIVAGDVPPALRDVSVRMLDIGLLQAGASMKGEFEQRLRSVIDDVQAAPRPVILFIDEVHTLIGAGGAAGTGDAANLLKPALARGTLRTIAATTWDEYKRYIEKDPALTRRFQVVKVEEPDEERCIRMMRAVMRPFERHHRVQILDEAIEAAVRLSHRYISARQLPDKAVSLIDTACARVAVSQHAVPASVDGTRARIRNLVTEQASLQREEVLGFDHQPRICRVESDLAAENERLSGLEQRWNDERTQVGRILELRQRLAEGDPSVGMSERHGAAVALAQLDPLPEGRGPMVDELKRTQESLREFQGDAPLVFPNVDASAIASVVADWTGIPVGRMMKNEVSQVLGLAEALEKRVIGQRHALEVIARRIRTSRARLDNPNRPVGVFLLAGPSGTGKTETALALSEAMFGGEQNLISINMSEFQEAHTVSTLKGSPPGYVGYGEGGVLTEAVRRRPYSVVLLDEVEKAHPDVYEIFFQVFDKGWMEDAEGRYIDFRNTIILLTTNAAQDVVTARCRAQEHVPDAEALEKAMRGPLTKVFPDALLNRLAVVPYYPITADILERIIRLNLSRVVRRVEENHGVVFSFDETVPQLIARRCNELERGARMVDALITTSILPEIGRELLTRTASGGRIQRVDVSTAPAGFVFDFS